MIDYLIAPIYSRIPFALAKSEDISITINIARHSPSTTSAVATAATARTPVQREELRPSSGRTRLVQEGNGVPVGGLGYGRFWNPQPKLCGNNRQQECGVAYGARRTKWRQRRGRSASAQQPSKFKGYLLFVLGFTVSFRTICTKICTLRLIHSQIYSILMNIIEVYWVILFFKLRFTSGRVKTDY